MSKHLDAPKVGRAVEERPASFLNCSFLPMFLSYLAPLFLTAGSGTAIHHDTSFGKADATLQYQWLLYVSWGSACEGERALSHCFFIIFSATIWLFAVQTYCFCITVVIPKYKTATHFSVCVALSLRQNKGLLARGGQAMCDSINSDNKSLMASSVTYRL